MGYTDQRLYRARALEPIVALGDVLYLLDQSGPISKYDSPYFAVVGIEPVRGLTPHNLLILWSQAGTLAGYGTAIGSTTLIPEVASGNINNGNFVEVNNPKILQQGVKQLFHTRFALKSLALTGPKEQDIELQVYMPGAAGKFGILAASPGFVNMVDQFQDQSDVIDAPAQGANQTLPAAFPLIAPRDDANLSEMFIWEINGPKFRIWNNGSAAATAGAIGVRMWGFRYDLAPLTPNKATWVDQWVYGRVRKAPPCPNRIVVVPTAPFGATSSY